MRRCLALIITLVFLLVAMPGKGQDRPVPGDKIPLISFLNRLAKVHQVNFTYNVKVISGLEVVLPERYELPRQLDYLASVLPLEFKLASPGNYTIRPIRKPLQFQVNDSQDDKPIELVYVTVNNEKQFYLIPNQGRYTLSNSFPTDSLHIRTSFYRPVVTTAAAVVANGNQVYLSQDTVNLGEVTVHSYLTSGVNSYLGDHRVEIDMNDLALIAGETDGDVFQVLQAIPGIRSPNGKPGSLNFRGSPFSQNLTLFDNIPIYHTGHFFGTFSPYNPGIVDRISVYRGTLPARYGGRVGGLIEVETSDQVPDSTKTELLANAVFAGLELETPVTRNLGLQFSFRSNYPIDYLSPKLQAFSDLNFQGSRLSANQLTLPGTSLEDLNIRFGDFNARLVYDLGRKHKLSASYLWIDNRLDYELDVPRDRRNQTHITELDNTGINLGWRALWSEKFNTSISFTNSSFRIYEDREDDQEQNANGPEREILENTINDTRFSALFNLELNPATKLNFGYEYKTQDVDFLETQRNNVIEQNEGLSGDGLINSFHGSIEQQLGAKLVMTAGLHVDFFNLTSQQFFDPRVSLTYLATKNFFLKASGGRAHQYIRQTFGNDFDDFRVGNQFWLLVDRDQQVVEGTQFMLGALYDKSDWLIDIEVYRNQTLNISRVRDAEPDPNLPGEILGDLRTVGLDFLVKKRWPTFETWLSYTLGNTKDRFARDRNFQPTYYDQRNALNVKWLYPRDRWSLALSWNMMSGLPVIEPDDNEIENPQGPDVLTVDYDGRFPIQHQMDLSATYQFTRPNAGWRGVIGFSVLNLYNRQNVINIFQENVRVGDEVRYGVGIAPNIQVKITF